MKDRIVQDPKVRAMSHTEMVKTLAKSLREYTKNAKMAPIFLALEVGMECAIPFLTAALIDKIKAGADMNTIGFYGAILVIIALLSLVFGTLSGIHASDASAGLAKNLRTDMFDNVQRFSFTNIDKFSAPSLVTRLTTDTTNVQQSFMMTLVLALRAPIMLIFAIVMAWIMAGKVALIYLFVGPLLGVALFFIFRKAMPVFARVFMRYDVLNERVEENIHGIREVKSYVREDYEGKKFEDATFDLYKDFSLAAKLINLGNPAMNLSVDIVFTFVMYVGSYLIISTKATALDVGQFSALTTYGFMILASLMMFSMVFVMISMAEESARRICEVLLAQPTITSPENGKTQVADGTVDFDHVNFKYSQNADECVLEDINLHIPSGSTLGILGATGSSKTSLAQLIPRLYDVTSGSLSVADTNVKEYDLESLRSAIALVEQKNMLFSGTIFDNLRWGNEHATEEEMIEASKIACADEFISKFPDGYNTQISQGGANVSGGQKQRICIARALLKHPKVLIFDDSTSAVDTKTDAIIRNNLKTYAPETTKIIIAQRITSIQDADLICVMDNGKIVDRGTHEQLMESSHIYRETYLSQTKVEEKEEEAINHE